MEVIVLLLMGALSFMMVSPTDEEKETKAHWTILWWRGILVLLAMGLLIVLSITYHGVK